ncbi:sucrose utilization SUC1 [Fusarium albosuccineum]|uniref:Sucrose utilization SUC1 n=1 Tax=Fusarium albosuccineum TaxID=1237068 RepID=A0A8H4L1A0_9HYPO|nr:sucrose utilization SUC1 [Fusarium albosuccineum]
MSSRLRNANPCDGCALRRVKCQETRPCHECRVRGIECTVLRVRRKRGPKGGPRSATKAKVEAFQRNIKDAQLQDSAACSTDDTQTSPNDDATSQSSRSQRLESLSLPRTPSAPSSPLPHYRLPLDIYRRFLHIFKRQAYSIWPVVNSNDLFAKITRDDKDYEAHALAASLCAATIAQLRVSEHTPLRNTVSSLQFATECLQFRELYDHRETFTIASVLIPFFLHIYYANANKLRTAGLFLRESITYVQFLELGHPETYSNLDKRERSLRLRVYWLLFISERTYSVQHRLPAMLQAIDTLPDVEDDMGDEHLMQAFISLARLFAYLEGNFTTYSSSQQPLERQKLVSYQADLCLDSHDHDTLEAQRVDHFVTRQWIRLLLWEYTARHFAMSCYPDYEAFNLFLPVKIGHEMLSLFSMATDAAIKAHGYGIELKVFRLADTMMDIVACTPWSARGSGMLVGSGDILDSLQRVLLAVGGQESTFLQRMHAHKEVEETRNGGTS